MKPEGSSCHSQGQNTCPFSKPDQSSQAPPSVHFLKINFNITFLSIPGSTKLSISLRFPHQTLYAPLLVPYVPQTPPILFFFILSFELYLVKGTD